MHLDFNGLYEAPGFLGNLGFFEFPGNPAMHGNPDYLEEVGEP